MLVPQNLLRQSQPVSLADINSNSGMRGEAPGSLKTGGVRGEWKQAQAALPGLRQSLHKRSSQWRASGWRNMEFTSSWQPLTKWVAWSHGSKGERFSGSDVFCGMWGNWTRNQLPSRHFLSNISLGNLLQNRVSSP